MCLGTIMCGQNRVWAQTCVGTIVSGHNRVGSSMYGHNRVVSAFDNGLDYCSKMCNKKYLKHMCVLITKTG